MYMFNLIFSIFRMRKVPFIILVVLGSILSVFLLIQILSVFIYSEKQSKVENMQPAFTTDSSYMGRGSGDALYNNEEGSKVQKTGTVTMLVKNIDDTVDSMESVNSKYSAQVTNIYDYGRGNERFVQITVKVPVESFETYYEELRGLDGEVTYANIGTNDLTEQYIDITSRLANLRQVETQLVEILKSASTIQDILAVQKELNTVRSDIERYEAQKRYFDSQTDYAYISITFSIDKEGLNISDEPWKPLGEFRAALNALVSVIRGLANAVIWMLVFSPLVLIPVGILILVTKRKQVK